MVLSVFLWLTFSAGYNLQRIECTESFLAGAADGNL